MAITTPAGGRSNYVAQASTVFPVAVKLALLRLLLHDYALMVYLKQVQCIHNGCNRS